MSNVQQPRRGANRRVLKAGVALSAVLALSYGAQTAAAIACPTNTGDTGNSDSDNDLTTATAMADCKVDAGYYVSVGGGATGTAGTVTAAPADHYAAGGVAVDTTTATDIWDGTAGALATATGAGVTKCPDNTNSDEGSDAIDDCKVNAGYYISVAGTSGGAGTVTKVPANHFAVGGVAVDTTTGTNIWNGAAGSLASATGAGVYKCPYAGTSAAGSSAQSDCTPDCSTTNADSGAEALGTGTCVCSVGTYQTSGMPTAASGGEAAANGCIKCSTTFSSATAAGITSGLSSTVKGDCVTQRGYIMTSPAGTPDALITVAPAPAGTYQPSMIVLSGNGYTHTFPAPCHANSNSVAGAAGCTCNDGYVPALGGVGCQPAPDAAAASPTAASPTADSAGASTPIAVALAAAAAVPLLL
jgi:hypothetical protein